MPSLEEVLAKLQAEPVIEHVDWDAPEAGQFPPRLLPGVYDFLFALEDDPFSAVEIPQKSGHHHLQVAFKADIVDPKDPTNTVQLRFQRASSYKHEKMPIDMLSDLVRSLGHRLPPGAGPEEYTALLQGISGRAKGRGEVGWRRYCKACDMTVSTHPRKNDVKWPRDAASGKPFPTVECPGCSDKGYGREEIVRFRLPEKAAASA